MPTYKKKINFVESEEGAVMKQALLVMHDDTAYNTDSSYSANNTLHPDNIISFVEKHMTYLSTHPSVEPKLYLANLRLITKRR